MLPAQIVDAEGCAVIAGAVLICSVAGSEVSAGVHVPEIMTRYWYPSVEAEAEVNESVAVVAPVYIPVLETLFQPDPVFDCHWYVNEVPVAVTPKVVLLPAQIVEEYEGGINAFLDVNKRIKGISTGFARFDEMTGGLREGELFILAARPAICKVP